MINTGVDPAGDGIDRKNTKPQPSRMSLILQAACRLSLVLYPPQIRTGRNKRNPEISATFPDNMLTHGIWSNKKTGVLTHPSSFPQKTLSAVICRSSPIMSRILLLSLYTSDSKKAICFFSAPKMQGNVGLFLFS